MHSSKMPIACPCSIMDGTSHAERNWDTILQRANHCQRRASQALDKPKTKQVARSMGVSSTSSTSERCKKTTNRPHKSDRLRPPTTTQPCITCQKTISILETAEVGLPIASDLACSGQWHAFVIPAWKRAAAKMDDDKARQIAIENIRRDHNEAYRAEKLGDNK